MVCLLVSFHSRLMLLFILQISQVASLASQLERERIFEGDQQRESANVKARRAGIDEVVEEEAGHEDNDKDETNSQGSASVPHSAKSLLIGERNEDGSPDGVFTQAQKNRIDRLLGNWDEPDAAPYVVAVSKDIFMPFFIKSALGALITVSDALCTHRETFQSPQFYNFAPR